MAVGAVLLGVGVPRVAEAFPGDSCGVPVPGWVELRSARIAANGVLTFRLSSPQGGDLRPFLGYLEVEVTDLDGAVIPGAVEIYEGFGVIAWRPDVAWTPDTEVEVAWFMDPTLILAEVYGVERLCPEITGRERVEVVAEELPADAPTIAESFGYEVEPSTSLESFVCCGRQYPRYKPASEMPGVCPQGRNENLDYCAAARGTGYLTIAVAVSGPALTETQVDNLDVRIAEPYDVLGSPAVWNVARDTAPFCATVEILDLARGAIHEFEVCHEGDPTAALGEDVAIDDPLPELLACECPAFTCSVEDRAWQEEDCRPWDASTDPAELVACLAGPAEPNPQPEEPAEPDDDSDEPTAVAQGCGCRQGGGAATIMLLLVAGLRPRSVTRRRG